MKFRLAPFLAILGASLLTAAVIAQIDGGDRGVAPLDSSGSFEVSGIAVDVRAKTAEAARLGGWRIAQRKGWEQLWAKTHGGQGGAPALGDSALDGIVAGIVVENEQIGPNRYVATLGVLFDRARAGQILGVTGNVSRSAPMLVLPVQWTGGTAYSFEQRTEWQKAWARFRTNNSPIDYVRPSGTGSDPLLLNYGQTQRPGRNWWRMILDQYGAADVLIPQVRLSYSYPGGPVTGYFVARHGPGSDVVSSFALRVDSSDKISAMLDEGVRRMDAIYADALAMGVLRPDPSLIETPQIDPSLIENATEAVPEETPLDNATQAVPEPATTTSSFTIQFDTPDVGSVSGTESAVRSVPGVRSATTTSLALGGTSVMNVSFAGDAATLKLALEARGFRVSEGAGRSASGGEPEMNQPALPLDWPVDDGDAEFIVTGSNRAAVAHLERPGTWPVFATLLTGPRKSGRSLLGRVFGRRSGGRVIDDADRADERTLFSAWNEAQSTRRPLLLIAEVPPPTWKITLPDLASRLSATPTVTLGPPDDDLIGRLLAKQLERRGLELTLEVRAYLIPRAPRSHHGVIALADALDTASLARRRAVTIPLAREVLGPIDAPAEGG